MIAEAGFQRAGAAMVGQRVHARRARVALSLQKRVAATHMRESRKRKSLVRR